jgi:pimeloyl-ACP methyl ester carboxylesterase
VAIAYAARFPERIERLVLANTLPRWAPEQQAAMEAGIARQSGEPWYEDAYAALEAEQAGAFSTDEELADLAVREFPFYFARYGEKERAYLDLLRSEAPNADALRLFNREVFETFDVRPELAGITAPTLVVTGELDFITGPACATELENGLRNVETAILPGVGHFTFIEAPEAFRAAVLSFLGVAAPA